MPHFIAIGLPDNLRDRIMDIIPDDQPGVNWVGREDLHLTLFYCGSLGDDRRLRVINTLNQLNLPDTPFECSINGVDGFVDDDGKYHVIHLAVEKTDDLARLRGQIEQTIDPIVLHEQTYDQFRPHITLGRPTNWRTDQCEKFIKNHRDINIPPLTVDHIALYKSDNQSNSTAVDHGGRCYRRIYHLSFGSFTLD